MATDNPLRTHLKPDIVYSDDAIAKAMEVLKTEPIRLMSGEYSCGRAVSPLTLFRLIQLGRAVEFRHEGLSWVRLK
jgi:hypothetical protein